MSISKLFFVLPYLFTLNSFAKESSDSIILNGGDPTAFYRCDNNDPTEAYTDDSLKTKVPKLLCSSLKKISYSTDAPEKPTYIYVWEKKKIQNKNYLLVADKRGVSYWIREKNEEEDEADSAEAISDFLDKAQNKRIAISFLWDQKLYGKPSGKKFSLEYYKYASVYDVKKIEKKIWLQLRFYDYVDNPDTSEKTLTPQANLCEITQDSFSVSGWIPLHDAEGVSNIELNPCF